MRRLTRRSDAGPDKDRYKDCDNDFYKDRDTTVSGSDGERAVTLSRQ